MSQEFDFGQLVQLCRRTHEETQRSAARAADTYLVVRNWLFGWYIVEFEDGGADRSKLYGRKLIERLADGLKASGTRGCSPTNLRKFREFYRAYPEIQQTLSVESAPNPALENQQTTSVNSLLTSPASAGQISPIGPTPSDQFISPLAATSLPINEAIALLHGRFSLGWSHYVTLLTIDRAEERAFYEIEAAQGGWSVRELKRQIASSLYERLALSRDKDEVRQLASEGQVVEKASDLIKDPLVLEFLGLEEKPTYSENDLEMAIIDRLAKTEAEPPTVGTVLCGGKNDAVVELTLPKDANIHASQSSFTCP